MPGPVQDRYLEYIALSKGFKQVTQSQFEKNVSYFPRNQCTQHGRYDITLRLWRFVGQFDSCPANIVSDIAQRSIGDFNRVRRTNDSRFVVFYRGAPAIAVSMVQSSH